jgi:integrase
MQPTRRRIEPGIYERLDAAGERKGLEIAYKDAEGKTRRRAVAGMSLAAARDELAKARTRRTRREAEPLDPRATFGRIAEEFERLHVAGMRRNSQQAHRSALRRLRAEFGGVRLTAIDRAALRKFVAAERAEGLKANTIVGHLSTLRSIFSFARDDLGLAVAMPPLKPSERPQPADDAREHRILTDDELARLLAACSPRTRLYFQALAETGARASEVLGLTRRRLSRDTITIAEQAARGGGLAPLKTRQSHRTIEITRSLAAELALQGEAPFGHLTHRGIERAWSAAVKQADLGDPRPVVHDMRHSHVSGLIAAGWDLAEVAGRIGDSMQTTLRVYSHEFDASRRAERRRASLEARYGKAAEPVAEAHADVVPIR